MNLLDSSFLCLDIGRAGVRGCAHRVRSARIDKSAVYASSSRDTTYALKSVIDELERQIGAHFDTAYVTGDFGAPHFVMAVKSTAWPSEHKITAADVRAQIAQIPAPENHFPMHVVPLRYDTTLSRNLLSPVGHTDRRLISAFGAIFFPRDRIDEIGTYMRRAHIQADAFFDTHFIINATMRAPHETIMIIDLGAAAGTVSMWTDRGPVMYENIGIGGDHITTDIAQKLNIDFDNADMIKRAVASLTPMEMDRFTPADAAYDFSRADINDIVHPGYVEILTMIRDVAGARIAKYHPTRIILTGGGAEITGGVEFIENAFSIPVKKLDSTATACALASHIWAGNAAHIASFNARAAWWSRRTRFFKKIFRRRTRRPRARFIPIMPSTLCFDMNSPMTYDLFRAGGISAIHVDIMDGFYVDRVAGGIDELKQIRANTSAHLHVHLMTESPAVWAADAIAAGADTVIVSTNTSGVRDAIRVIHAAGRRAGIALHPDSSPAILKPVLRELDEVMVMSVTPGAAGQTFDANALKKIEILAATRKKYNLKFVISVDGGINAETAAPCWAAGSNMLVSGSYLARAADFPLAVHSLLPNNTTKQ